MSTRKRILIADDHHLVRSSLGQLVSTQADWELIGESATGADVVDQVKFKKPDLLLLDMSLPDLTGVQVVEAARMLHPEIKILIISAYAESAFVFSALQAGANGYLVKTEESNDILRAIGLVLDGYPYLSPEIMGHVISGYVKNPSANEVSERFAELTPREREVVDCILQQGLTTNKEIGGQLFVGPKTIERHKTHIFTKLDVENTQKLIDQYGTVTE